MKVLLTGAFRFSNRRACYVLRLIQSLTVNSILFGKEMAAISLRSYKGISNV